MKDGFKYVLKNKLVLFICLGGALLNALLAPMESLGVVYVNRIGMEADGLSLINGASLVGMALGGIIFPKINRKLNSKLMFILGGIMAGIGYSILSIITYMDFKQILIIVSMLILGAGTSFISMPVGIAFMRKIDRDYISRANSIMNALLLCAMPLASFFAGIVVKFISVELLYGVLGVATIIVFLALLPNKTLEDIN